jgi:predicted DNA-binding protein
MKKESDTIQIGLRIEKDLLESLEFFAKNSKIDKMAMIRQAIASYVTEMEDSFEDAAIEDYICLRIDEQEFKEHTGLKEIPKDIKEARQETIKSITKERMKR